MRVHILRHQISAAKCNFSYLAYFGNYSHQIFCEAQSIQYL